MPFRRHIALSEVLSAEYEYRCAICGATSNCPTEEAYPEYPKPTPSELAAYGRRVTKFLRRADTRREEFIEYYASWVAKLAEEMREEISKSPARVRLHCHEIWEYDDKIYVQRIAGFVALCVRCHQIKHWHLAGARKGRDGKIHQMGAWRWGLVNHHQFLLEDHFMWGNNCDLTILIEHIEEVAQTCFRRSQHEWRIEFGEFV